MTAARCYSAQRDELNQAIASQAPAELLDGFAATARRLDAVDFASRAPRVGDRAPEFALPDHNGEEVDLSALVREGPVVLIFYRGEWCPYCNLQLRTFQARLEEIASRGRSARGDFHQTPDHSLSMAGKNSLAFPVLSDVGAHVSGRYGLRYEVDADFRALLEAAGNDVAAHNGPGGWALPAAATFVMGGDGEVRYARVTGDWTERAGPSEVLAVLDEIT